MKKLLFLLVSLMVSGGVLVQAQEKSTTQEVKEGTKKTARSVKKGAKKFGQKTAEVASKATAKLVDRTYDGKAAPNGKTVYITEDSRYYWVDDNGKRQYVAKEQLIDKPNQK